MGLRLSNIPLFKDLNFPEPLYNRGRISDHVYHFEAGEGESSRHVFTVEFLLKEEAVLWHSVRDMLVQSLNAAALRLKGVFEFELLSTGSGANMRSFQPGNFTALIANHGIKLEPGSSAFVRYTEFCGILRKLTPAEFGKISLRHGVAVLPQSRDKWDLLISRSLKAVSQQPCGNISLVMNYLGGEPVFRFGEEPQTERIGRTLEKALRDFEGRMKWVYVLQSGGCFDLLNQFCLKKA